MHCNKESLEKIGFGGGCHWCTEAVFASLKGVCNVEQGYISSVFPNDEFSEAVVVTYCSSIISLRHLTEVHLYTHSSTSQHSLRKKYRSAVYCFKLEEAVEITSCIRQLQINFQRKIITQVLPFAGFQFSLPQHQNYYVKNPEMPFCKTYILPKLDYLKKHFAGITRQQLTNNV